MIGWEIVKNMHPLPEPLPSHENGNLDSDSSSSLLQGTKIFPGAYLGKEELARRRKEGRLKATPKSAYVKAILRHCRECFGMIPVRTDCEGHTRMDGTDCNLYHFNTAEKCRASTKSVLKKAIRKECSYCGGDKRTCGQCPLQSAREH